MMQNHGVGDAKHYWEVCERELLSIDITEYLSIDDNEIEIYNTTDGVFFYAISSVIRLTKNENKRFVLKFNT